MTPALKRGSRSRPSSVVLEESAGRRPGKRTRSASSLPLSSEPSASIYASFASRSRSSSRPTTRERLHRDIESPAGGLKESALADRMAPESTTTTTTTTTTTVETETIPAGVLESLNGSTRSTLPGTRRKHISHASDRDSESSLSDIGEDSEAETERLHNSPQKQRTKLPVHSKGIPSPAVVPFPIGFPVKEAAMNQGEDLDTGVADSVPVTPTTSNLSKKRKRESNGSPCPRPVEESKSRPSTPPLKKKLQISQETPENNSTGTNGGRGLNTEARSDPDSNGVAKDATTTITKDTAFSKSTKTVTPNVEASNNPEKTQGPDPIGGEEIDEGVDVTALVPPEEEAGDNVDTREDDEDAERVRRKNAAMEDLADIERVFAQLKDKIYSEKLRRVDMEMRMVQDGTHPEFMAQKACIDHKLEEKVRLADAQYKYAMESLAIATRVNRAQVHAQYFQSVRRKREDALESCSELWYQIQRERRAGDALVSEFSYRISELPDIRIKQRQQYNWEVALLSGISEHIGFPAAPDVLGASEEEVVDDLESMGIAPRPPARTGVTAAPTARERISEELYERPLPIHWPPMQNSPPPTVAQQTQQTQQAQQSQQTQQTHSYPHVHIHHHHHHSRRHAGPTQSDQISYPRRFPPLPGPRDPGPQPAHVPLSALLHSDLSKIELPSRPSNAPPLHSGGSQTNRSTQYLGASHHSQATPRQSQLFSSQGAQY